MVIIYFINMINLLYFYKSYLKHWLIKKHFYLYSVDGERKPREKGVRRGPYKRQKQLQHQNSSNDLKNKNTEKDGLQKTRQKRKKTQKQLKQESEAENTTDKVAIPNSVQTTNSSITGTVQG